MRAKATAKFSRLFVTNYDYSSLTIQSALEGGCISFTSSDSSSVYAVYAYKGAVVMRDVKIECMNYAGTYVGKRMATAVYTGRDVPLSMRVFSTVRGT